MGTRHKVVQAAPQRGRDPRRVAEEGLAARGGLEGVGIRIQHDRAVPGSVGECALDLEALVAPLEAGAQALVGSRDEAVAGRELGIADAVATRPVRVLAEQAEPSGHEDLEVVGHEWAA